MPTSPWLPRSTPRVVRFEVPTGLGLAPVSPTNHHFHAQADHHAMLQRRAAKPELKVCIRTSCRIRSPMNRWALSGREGDLMRLAGWRHRPGFALWLARYSLAPRGTAAQARMPHLGRLRTGETDLLGILHDHSS